MYTLRSSVILKKGSSYLSFSSGLVLGGSLVSWLLVLVVLLGSLLTSNSGGCAGRMGRPHMAAETLMVFCRLKGGVKIYI